MTDVIGTHNPDPATGVKQIWKPNTGQDTARFIIRPGEIRSATDYSPGNLAHVRPFIINGNKLFGFPVGVESFRRSGQASLGLHRNIGASFSQGQTTNHEEGRIELSGMFPGITSQDKMNACLEILTTPQRNGVRVYMPGVFDGSLICLPESWDFSHAEDDRTHSIAYTLSFVIIGEGQRISDPKGKPPQSNPSIRKKPKGKPAKIFTVRANARTLQSVARIVYKDARDWRKLVAKNQGQVNAYVTSLHLSSHQLPTYRWPIGTKFSY